MVGVEEWNVGIMEDWVKGCLGVWNGRMLTEDLNGSRSGKTL